MLIYSYWIVTKFEPTFLTATIASLHAWMKLVIHRVLQFIPAGTIRPFQPPTTTGIVM